MTTTFPSLARLDDMTFTFVDDEYNVTESLRCVVRIEPDEHMTVDDDGDVFGELVHISRFDDYGQRPRHFTGRARKISTGDGSWWWQPPADLVAEYDEQVARSVKRLLEDGYSMIHVIARDADETQIGEAWLGGCDHEYGADITFEVRDLFAEIIENAWSRP